MAARRIQSLGTILLTACAVALVAAPIGARSSNATQDPEPITPIPATPVARDTRVALGEELFHDPRLAGDGTRTCASCHDLRTNGAAANVAAPVVATGSRPFNVPTIFNATLSFRYGWEGTFRTLESQAAASIENPQAMGASLDDVVMRLSLDPRKVRQFKRAYDHAPNAHDLLDALAAFERSLATPDSRFDRWLGGDAQALSARELEGYRLFKSVGCVSCHQGVNVGGNLYQKQSVFRPVRADEPVILRVPSLRNVATTAPYFHDGSARTLPEAVKRMGVAQLNSELAPDQINTIVAWLQTLTGVYRGQAVEEQP